MCEKGETSGKSATDETGGIGSSEFWVMIFQSCEPEL